MAQKRKNTAAQHTAKRKKKPEKHTGGDPLFACSIGMFAAGALLIAMLFVEGQSAWAAVRTALFGVFGGGMYLLGVAVLYLAVLLEQGEAMLKRTLQLFFALAVLSGLAVLFSRFQPEGKNTFALLASYYKNGADSVFGGGVMGMVLGGLLLHFCGRPAANIIAVVAALCMLMWIAGMTPAHLWEIIAGALAAAKNRGSAAHDELRELRAERAEQLEQTRREALAAPQELPGADEAARKKPTFFHFGHKKDEAGEAVSLSPAAETAVTETAPESVQSAASPAARAAYDIDLGPDPTVIVPGEAEPIEPAIIGPGGTFGMDPLGTKPPLDEFSAPVPAPTVILPDGTAPQTPASAAAPAPVLPHAVDTAPGPAPVLPIPPAGAESGWIRMDAAPAPDASIDNLAAAALAKPHTAEAAAAKAPETPLEMQANAYRYPPLTLFDKARSTEDTGAEAELKANAQKLVETLESFGVKTRVLDISRGPSVTRYELQPLAGVKISRITSLADDIALNLAVAGVRMEAPIPGKPAVGIEVPNRKSVSVQMRSILESQNYAHMASPLTLALGKDIAGVAQVADLCKMPHLLIAGSTGSGKSVCVNSIIISFLYRASPEDVRLILIDPKVVELAEYNGIPHLLMPVVTEPRKAAGALGSAVAEMEKRYRLFADNNVRDIKTFNRLAAETEGLEKLPYIAIVIDELADLMMVAGKEVEDSICRIAQKARAAGMHLIVATQRPSVDVITGLIKANIPSRIAFAVSSQVDSRTILDTGGAEKLLGMGDMLFMPVGASKATRIQGTYVTDEEISHVLDFIKKDSSAQYDETMIAEMEKQAAQEKGGSNGAADDDGGTAMDPMLKQAAEVVIDAGQASTSLLQRRCKLGYARAARIMDEMEEMHIIGPYEGAKPRAVLVSRQQWIEMCANREQGPVQLSTDDM